MANLAKGFLLTALLCFSAHALAIRMVPIVAEVESDGAPVERSFRVDNPSGSPAAVEISVFRRSTTLDGEEIREPAADQLAVFPEQMVLLPGESQLVRVQWLGGEPVTDELAFRVIAEELPVDFGEEAGSAGGGPSLSLLMRYEGMLYVQPPQTRAHVELLSFRIVEHEDEPHLELVLVNSGNVHVIVSKPDIKVVLESGRVELSQPELQQLFNVNMLAGEQRRFLLPWPGTLEPDKLEVQFRYEPAD